MKLKNVEDFCLNHFLNSFEEQKQMQIHGIDTKIISSLSIETNGQQKGQLDAILNQLNQENFLVTENPFFELDQLKIKKELGNGSFGVVYLTEDKNTNDLYAVKISKLKVDEESRYSDQTLSIYREINLMSSFNHPNILKFIGYSPTNFEGSFYPTIIMEYCQNKTLSDIIKLSNKGLSPEKWDDTTKLINIYGIASGMKYLHEQNIVHRDLKTQNILMDDQLFPKIADFGLSKMTKISENSPSLNAQSMADLKGTPLYMAPEILLGNVYSKEGDVYAFAIILFELVTGKIPFKGLDLYQLIKRIPDGERPFIDGDVDDHYRNLIESCWSQDPGKRPTFGEIVDELKNNRKFITDSIDESKFIDFIEFVDNYGISFDLSKKHITFDDFVKGKHKHARNS